MSTITLTNNTLIHSESLRIGVDKSNVIASGSRGNLPYTATQDCYFNANLNPGNDNMGGFAVNGMPAFTCGSTNQINQARATFFIKKGDVVSVYTVYHNVNELNWTAYGLK